MNQTQPPPTAWSPLSQPLFRALWIATVISNIGTWIHEVGAGWLMVTLDPHPVMVSLVQAATALPIFLLALPGGDPSINVKPFETAAHCAEAAEIEASDPFVSDAKCAELEDDSSINQLRLTKGVRGMSLLLDLGRRNSGARRDG